ncbi:MAG: type II toxin-antitoxin system RelE family toxin [Candidatus Electronema sp. V4]|uniref:type II toxin-antitoxin system RelE family toxin n=1 Tax=Candidatus Electronema sp. V4 TaxID=3454756 RepID=UPI00405599F6
MRIVNTTPIFRKAVRKLLKPYPRLKEDFLPLLEQLENGTLPGVPLSGFAGKIWKARFASSDQRKGKSGGFRLIYLADEKAQELWLLTLYAKSEQTDIRTGEILDSLS